MTGIRKKKCSSCGREFNINDENALLDYVKHNRDVPTGLQMLDPRNWGKREEVAEQILESMDEIQCWGCMIENSA